MHGNSARFTRRDALKLGALGLGAGATLPILSACGGKGKGGSSDGSVVFQGWDYQSQLVQQNINNFTKLNPKIKVKYTPITSAQYVQKLVAEFTGGAQPDALYVYDDSMAGWVDAGYLQPIDGMPGVDKVYDSIYPGNAQTMTYKGKRYGLPYYTDSQCLLYNEAILTKAGIAAPPKTLQELTDQAKKIQSAGILEAPIGQAAQLSDTWWAWVWALYYASGAKVFDDQLDPVMNTTDTATRNVLDWLHDAAVVSKVFDKAALQLAAVPFDNAFMAGKYAFTIGARYAAREYNDPSQSKVAGKVKMALIPGLSGTNGTVSNTRMYALTKNNAVKDDAFKLISYLGGFDSSGQPYTAKFWFQNEGLGFAYKSMASDPKVQAQLKKFADPVVYDQLAQSARPRNVILAPWYTEYETAQQKIVQQLITNQTSASSATKSLSDTATTLKKKYS